MIIGIRVWKTATAGFKWLAFNILPRPPLVSSFVINVLRASSDLTRLPGEPRVPENSAVKMTIGSDKK